MKGAREFAKLFATGQYDKLYITSGSHARGLTFRIQVLPEGEKADSNGQGNMCTNDNAVEVYGVVSGNPGWTESYGWLHHGNWCEDFRILCEAKREEQAREAESEKTDKQRIEQQEADRKARILAAY